jgi:hypothetical protein
VVEMLLLLPRGVGFEPMLGHIIFYFFPLISSVAVVWLWLGTAIWERRQPWTPGRGRGVAMA